MRSSAEELATFDVNARDLPITPLPRSWYERPTVELARTLLDSTLLVESSDGLMAGRVAETEAYVADDPASHAFRGKTARNAPMFGPAGHAYVYFTYGMHYCFNVVTGSDGLGEAVLIRALEPLFGWEQMIRNRRLNEQAITIDRVRLGRALCGGPARLCQALGLGRSDSGLDLTTGERVWLSEPPSVAGPAAADRIVASRRIGISVGVDSMWRFTLRDDPFTSRPAPRTRSTASEAPL